MAEQKQLCSIRICSFRVINTINRVNNIAPFQKIKKNEMETPAVQNTKNQNTVNESSKIQDTKKQDTVNCDTKYLNNSLENKQTFKNNSIKESVCAPADVKNVYGDYQNVKLTQSEYDSLIQNIGEKKTKHYIKRIGATMANKGTRYASHYRTILDWCEEDTEKEAEKPKQAVQAYSTPKNKNRFINYEQSEWDFDLIEKLEEEYIEQRLVGNR